MTVCFQILLVCCASNFVGVACECVCMCARARVRAALATQASASLPVHSRDLALACARACCFLLRSTRARCCLPLLFAFRRRRQAGSLGTIVTINYIHTTRSDATRTALVPFSIPFLFAFFVLFRFNVPFFIKRIQK